MAATHMVQPGDTLWGISRLYGVNLDDLRAANNLTADVIYPGQELVIPLAEANRRKSYPRPPCLRWREASICRKEATPPRIWPTWNCWPALSTQKHGASPTRAR